ncbi:hypothetical protein, partial [Staphylococcus aureus]|uniref:hypothetical protein n=2 Tax=Staphylococcus aureus TaxID=1280 RepID=UPI00301D73CC
MQQTIDQLRANSKGHKKTVDKLSAKVSQLTQQLTNLNQQMEEKEDGNMSLRRDNNRLRFEAIELKDQLSDATTKLYIEEQAHQFYKTELEMRGYKTFHVNGSAAMTMPVELEGKSALASAFAFVGCSFAVGFF